MIKFLIALVIDVLLVIGALTFQDPLPPLIVAVLLFPVIWMSLACLDPRIRNGANWDPIQMQNYYHLNSMARDIHQINERGMVNNNFKK